jgi:pilus assembly protein CpaF
MGQQKFIEYSTGKTNCEQQEEGAADSFEKALSRVRSRLSSTFTPDQVRLAGPSVRDGARSAAAEIYTHFNAEAAKAFTPRLAMEQDVFVSLALSYLFGLGPLEPLLADESVEDVAINGHSEVMVFKDGRWVHSMVAFSNVSTLREMLNSALAHANRRVNSINPIADAALRSGERISVVTDPIARPWPTAVIRVPRAKEITLADLLRGWERDEEEEKKQRNAEILENTPILDYSEIVRSESLIELGKYIHASVLAGLNIAVLGPTGVGKTTTLMAFGRLIPKDRRILIIEDTPEFNLWPSAERPHNILYVCTRPPSMEGVPGVTQADLVRLALRQRPDALTLGEARGEEIYDLLVALSTGHKNGLTSIHAYGVEELADRVIGMIGSSERGRYLDSYRAAKLLSTCINVVIALEKSGEGRRVRTVAELTGGVVTKGDSHEPRMNVMFQRNGSLNGPVNSSVFGRKFLDIGIPKDVFEPA